MKNNYFDCLKIQISFMIILMINCKGIFANNLNGDNINIVKHGNLGKIRNLQFSITSNDLIDPFIVTNDNVVKRPLRLVFIKNISLYYYRYGPIISTDIVDFGLFKEDVKENFTLDSNKDYFLIVPFQTNPFTEQVNWYNDVLSKCVVFKYDKESFTWKRALSSIIYIYPNPQELTSEYEGKIVVLKVFELGMYGVSCINALPFN